MTNANYERHGMKPIILGNNEKYDNEFKKKRTITLKKWKKFLKEQKTKMRLNFKKEHDDHGGGH